MATIKSFTSLKQSRKLAEILPLESADMHYCLEQRDVASGYEIGITSYTKAKSFTGKCNIIDVQPSWSLAVLLDVLPKIHSLKPILDLEECSIQYSGIDLYVVADNPVDACVNMIIKLKENELI